MLRSNKMKSFLLLFLMVGSAAMAQTMNPSQKPGQTDVSDKELSQFVEAYQAVQPIQQQFRSQMMSKIKEEGLTPQEFSTMRNKSMDPNKEMTASAEKQESFKEVKSDLQEMQPEMQKKVDEVVKKAGLTTQRFQQIAQAVQTDKELQRKVQNKMMKKSSNMQQKAPTNGNN